MRCSHIFLVHLEERWRAVVRANETIATLANWRDGEDFIVDSVAKLLWEALEALLERRGGRLDHGSSMVERKVF